jgi:membrane protease YdiL (CAAX protease family)
MMQQLLRGWLLYIGLGAVVVGLYVQVLRGLSEHGVPDEDLLGERLSIAQPFADGGSASDEMTLAWWPQDLTPQALTRVARRQPLLAMALSLWSLAITGLAVAGVLLTVWAIWTRRLGAVFRYPARPPPPWSLGELARIIALAMLVCSLLPLVRLGVAWFQREWEFDSPLWIPVTTLVVELCVILGVFAFAAGKGTPARGAIGLTTFRLRAALAVGLRGYVAVFPWVLLALFLTVELLRAFEVTVPVEPIQKLLLQERDPLVVGLTVALACVIGPVAEELLFRGVLYAALRRRLNRPTALLAGSAIFALIHANPVGCLSLFLMGILLADLYERTGTLWCPLIVHIAHNTLLTSLALVVRQLLAAV